MSNVLVYIQGADKVAKISLAAITAANDLKAAYSKNEILGICLGKGAKDIANDALNYGFSKVFYSEDITYEKFLARNYANAISKVASENDCSLVVAAASSNGRDALPMVAAKLDAGQASDILAVNDDASLRRPMYAGNIIADVEISTENKIITVRASSFDAASPGSASGEVVEITDLPEAFTKAEVLSYEMPEKERPELSDADVVVSGGRAFASTENFEKYLYPLADVLDAAVGASRAAVDSGYVPNDWQVGQTGKIVAPNLYFAIGLSGAIQHLAGMKDSKVIVAINKDAEAPIFEISDYGLVGDLFEILPELTEKIKQAKS